MTDGTFHDPFAGAGSLPLEAQRLGLDAHASDLNPVAVLINKAMIEIPPKFAGRPAVNPESRGEPTVVAKTWRGAQGLADDVRRYGQWMRDEAEKRIGHHPRVAPSYSPMPSAGRIADIVGWWQLRRGANRWVGRGDVNAGAGAGRQAGRRSAEPGRETGRRLDRRFAGTVPPESSGSYCAVSGADSRAAPCGASARAAGGAAVVLERLADRGAAGGSVSPPRRRQVVLEGGRLRGDGRADDEVPGGRGGRDAR